jgi:hypothetical protein
MKPAAVSEPLTFRAVAIGLVACAALAVATPVSDFLLNGTWLAACHLPVGVVCVFVVLRYAIAPVIARLGRPIVMSEWVTIYSMMLVSAGLGSLGFAAYVVPILASIPYYATAENDWLALFGQHLPSWIAPFDERASRLFFEGGDAAIPWGLWARPLLLWSAYTIALLWAMTCICLLLRRQWIERERLMFPLVQLPLELLRPASTRHDGARGVLLLGVAIPFLIHGVNGLHLYFPSVPSIPLFYDAGTYLVEKPWDVLRPLWVILHFSAVGFVFLLPIDLSLSLWAFYFVFHAQSLLLVVTGLPLGRSTGYATRGFAAYQMAGGILLIAALALWRARRSLREQLHAAMRPPDDEDGPLSSRGAYLGLLGSAALLAVATTVAGAPVGLAVWFVGVFLVTTIAMTRMVGEGGLLFIQTPFRPTDLLVPFAGGRVLGAGAATVLAYPEMLFAFDVRASPMPSVMDSLKLLDSSTLRRRGFLAPVLAACAVTMVVSACAVLVIGYHNGAGTVSGWFGVGAPQLPFRRLVEQLTNPPDPDHYSAAWMGVGAIVVSGLHMLRARFLWFPFHPIGYAMGPSWPMIQLWFSTFLGWAFKYIALRGGGLRAFRTWRPFFLGLVLGEFGAGGFWAVVDFICGTQGHRIFLF